VSDPILQTLMLKRRFGVVEALRGLSLSVMPGELYGLVGPDGAGKTTTIRILAGLMGPTQGQVRVIGKDPLGGHREVRDALGYMPQQYSLYGDLTVDENLEFFGRMFCLEPEVYKQRSDRLLHITRLNKFTERRADALSGGMYKKLALACALLHRPKALLLDEPTNGVDPVSRRELWDLLGEFVSEGMTVLLATPYMDEAARCQRVGLIYEGRLLREGRPEELLREFEEGVFLVEGRTRDEVEDRLASFGGASHILALSPAGQSIRIVVTKEGESLLGDFLSPIGARLIPVRPEFEDMFLVYTRQPKGEESRGVSKRH
jgi:ABC-2 type transport system ATP-binding protein